MVTRIETAATVNNCDGTAETRCSSGFCISPVQFCLQLLCRGISSIFFFFIWLLLRQAACIQLNCGSTLVPICHTRSPWHDSEPILFPAAPHNGHYAV